MSSDQKKLVAEFVRLTTPHHRHLYGLALVLCHDADQAADLTQETLIRAFEAFDRFKRGASMLPWLRRILRNVFLDTFKAGRARHEVRGKDLDAPLGPVAPVWQGGNTDSDPLVNAERAQLVSWIQEELASLDPCHQQALQLCVMQGLSVKEAAELIDVPVGTIASRMARARAQLRERVLRRMGVSPAGSGSVFEESKDDSAAKAIECGNAPGQAAAKMGTRHE